MTDAGEWVVLRTAELSHTGYEKARTSEDYKSEDCRTVDIAQIPMHVDDSESLKVREACRTKVAE